MKFSDADLLGIPYRLVLSVKNEGKIEVKIRGEKEVKLLDVDKIIDELR